MDRDKWTRKPDTDRRRMPTPVVHRRAYIGHPDAEPEDKQLGLPGVDLSSRVLEWPAKTARRKRRKR